MKNKIWFILWMVLSLSWLVAVMTLHAQTVKKGSQANTYNITN